MTDSTKTKTPDQTRAVVRDHYAKVATRGGGCAPGCCAPGAPSNAGTLGYRPEDTALAPDGADLGLGCGNPTAIASLAPGETVLDLGAGGGFDAFIAAHRVGPTGRVIGVDMTAEMVELARTNARKVAATNVEFRIGEIEHLPVADASVDVIMSNCVVNLSPDKRAVYAEAFRVLRPGGRLAITDVVAIAPMPPELAAGPDALAGCIAGAASIDELRALLAGAGFVDVDIAVTPQSAEVVGSWQPGVERYAASAMIAGRKPAAGARAADAPAPARSCCGPECCA
jgi:SAM-dependent methyltransferase